MRFSITSTTATAASVAVLLLTLAGTLAPAPTASAARMLADDSELPYSLGPWLGATASAATLGVLEDALRDLDLALSLGLGLALDAGGGGSAAALPLASAHGDARAPLPRICFERVDAIEQQIVDGINFRFHVSGCALPRAAAAGASVSDGDYGEYGAAESTPPQRAGRCAHPCGAQLEAFRVTVFCQPWSHTTQVLSIAREAPVASAVASATAAA